MVTVDLNTNQRLAEIFQQIESGETVRLMRGDRLIALVTPATVIDEALWDTCNWDDETWFAAASKASAKALASEFPNEDFSDWMPPDAAR